MDFLIFSDSHGRSDLVGEMLSRCRPDVILCCGDGLWDLANQHTARPLYVVRGNCDVLPPPSLFVGGEMVNEVLVNEGGMRLLLMHGHTYNVKYGLESAIFRAAELDADALVFGHTHRRVNVMLTPEEHPCLKKRLHLFNPGSLHDAPHSFGTLTVRNGVPLFHHGELE